MPKINWIDKLNDEQVIYAEKIIRKAQEMGVPPQLAVALAYHESGLDPHKIGGAKEIGLMQVLPQPGAGLAIPLAIFTTRTKTLKQA
jgi:soluble lytic murein transglycosylase-like protein